MIIFLYGSDDYRREKKKKDIVEEFRKKRSERGLDFFDFDSADDGTRFEAFLRTPSLFDPVRLAVISNAFEMEPKKLAQLLAPAREEANVQVILSEKDKPVKALAFLLEKPTLVQKFDALHDVELMKLATDEARRNGLALAPAAAQFLSAVYEGDTWGLVTEIQKLSSFKKKIDKNDLNEFGLETAPNYWALLNGMKSYDLKNRMTALETLLAMNDPAPKLFNILAAQWTEKIPHMAEYDLAVKSGKIDYEEALVDLVIN